jgi:hypothetical protein
MSEKGQSCPQSKWPPTTTLQKGLEERHFFVLEKRINNKLEHFSNNFLKKKLCKSWSSKFNTWTFQKKCFVILRSRIQGRISFVHLDQLNIKLKTWFKKCFFILRFQDRLDWSTKYKTWNLQKKKNFNLHSRFQGSSKADQRNQSGYRTADSSSWSKTLKIKILLNRKKIIYLGNRINLKLLKELLSLTRGV